MRHPNFAGYLAAYPSALDIPPHCIPSAEFSRWLEAKQALAPADPPILIESPDGGFRSFCGDLPKLLAHFEFLDGWIFPLSLPVDSPDSRLNMLLSLAIPQSAALTFLALMRMALPDDASLVVIASCSQEGDAL